MKEVSTLKDLMIFHLVSLHDAEYHWSGALRDQAGFVTSPELKKIFQHGSRAAAEHTDKLARIISAFGKTTITGKNQFVQDLIREIRNIKDEAADPEVLDAGLAVTLQCMSHYLIAKYGTLASYARLLLEEHIASTLHQIMEEEKIADAGLTQLAETKLNIKAKAALIH